MAARKASGEKLTRRQRAERSLFDFGVEYFSDYMTAKSGKFHFELCEQIEQALLPGGRLVGMAPKEHAKSVWGTQIAPLYAAAPRENTGESLKHFIRLWCDTRLKAADKLGDVFAYTLEPGHPLIEDYGDALMPMMNPRSGRTLKFNNNEAVLGNGVKIIAMHFGGKARGMRWRQWRPDMDVLDDPEDEDEVSNRPWRERMKLWYDRQLVGGVGENSSIIHLGTLVHREAILAWLMDPVASNKPLWKRWDKYRDCWVVEPDADGNNGVSIWPEYWPPERLLFRKGEMTPRAFNSEMRNIPLSDEDMLIRGEWLTRMPPSRLDLESSPPMVQISVGNLSVSVPLSVVGGLDPALKQSERHCFSAVVVMGYYHIPGEVRNRRIILHIERVRDTPAQLVERCVSVCQAWKPSRFAVEAFGAQDIFAQQMAQRGIPVVQMNDTSKSKEQRIETGALAIEQRLVSVPAGAPWLDTFIEEAESYTGKDNDTLKDQLDAFAYANMLCEGGGYIMRQRQGQQRRERLHLVASGM